MQLEISFVWKPLYSMKHLLQIHFFVNAHHLIKMKVHLHHSHITGKIIGYVHDFCNARVKENNMEIPVIAHNLFGFDLYYFIKGYIASAWCLKELKIG